MNAIQSVKFFINKEITQRSELAEIAGYLKYMESDKGELIFDLGDQGQYFFIILQGECDVIVPILEDAPADLLAVDKATGNTHQAVTRQN